jgi:hypothetical protein
MKTKPRLDLSSYLDRFEDALRERYNGQTFRSGFAAIKEVYEDVRAGHRRLSVEDVMAIFDDELPFVQDWTKPDLHRLQERMKEHRVADAIYRLRDRNDTRVVLELISQIRKGFGDLSLTALVLHHVYPARFAMCSHHLASLLYIVNASTVPKFYLEYCEELKLWGKETSARQLNVVETEFALWTWYRLTYYGRNEEKRKNRDNFFKDPWIQDRRAMKIAEALQDLGRLDIARSYLDVDANLAAIIAWVEFERSVRNLFDAENVSKARGVGMIDLIDNLPLQAVPRSRKELKYLWLRGGRGRNEVVHQGLPLTASEAKEIVNDVVEFLAHNAA